MKKFIKNKWGILCVISLMLIVSVTIYERTFRNYNGKLIIVGDSRTRNMSKWVKTSRLETRFVAKSGQGYEWFIKDGISQTTELAEPGDSILVWLGVNDYSLTNLYDKYGKEPWDLYIEEINKLAKTEWAQYKVYVAGVGYVDPVRMKQFYKSDLMSNVNYLQNRVQIRGIHEYNRILKTHLAKNVKWINPMKVIGIRSDDYLTNKHIWVKRSNGSYDGLHYSKRVTQKIYNYFVRKVVSLNES